MRSFCSVTQQDLACAPSSKVPEGGVRLGQREVMGNDLLHSQPLTVEGHHLPKLVEMVVPGTEGGDVPAASWPLLPLLLSPIRYGTSEVARRQPARRPWRNRLRSHSRLLKRSGSFILFLVPLTISGPGTILFAGRQTVGFDKQYFGGGLSIGSRCLSRCFRGLSCRTRFSHQPPHPRRQAEGRYSQKRPYHIREKAMAST